MFSVLSAPKRQSAARKVWDKKNDTKVKKMAKMFAHYQKLCNFATELKEKNIRNE
jgi:hypothetical protein